MGRGQPPAPAIPMTACQVEVFSQLSRKHTTGQQLSKRAEIMLMASEGHSNSHTKRVLGISLNTVKFWRSRWLSAYEELLEAEASMEKGEMSRLAYEKQLFEVLSDQPRQGAPKTFSLGQEQQIVALACDKPRHHGLEMTDWTYAMLAKVAIAKGIVASISSSQVGRILKKYPTSTA